MRNTQTLLEVMILDLHIDAIIDLDHLPPLEGLHLLLCFRLFVSLVMPSLDFARPRTLDETQHGTYFLI